MKYGDISFSHLFSVVYPSQRRFGTEGASRASHTSGSAVGFAFRKPRYFKDGSLEKHPIRSLREGHKKE